MSEKEQLMSKDKYPSIFSPQIEAIVFVILQISFAICEALKIGEYSRIFPRFGWGIFGHVTCLDQLPTMCYTCTYQTVSHLMEQPAEQ